MVVLHLITLLLLQGQNPSPPDSVMTEQHHSSFEELIHVDADSAVHHLAMLKQLSAGNYLRTKFLYDYDLGYYLFTQHKLDSSFFHYQKSLDFAQRHDLKKEAVLAKVWFGNHLYFRNQVDAAEMAFKEVVDESTRLNYIDGIANGYLGLATLLNDDKEILLIHLKIDSLYVTHGKRSAILANSLGAIGRIYLESNFIESAKEYFEKSIDIAEKTNYLPGLDAANSIRGEIALKQHNPDEAEQYFKQAYAKSTQEKDTFYIAHDLSNLAKVDIARKEFENGIGKLKTSLDYFRLVKDSIAITNVNLQLANSYIGLGNLPEAKHHLDYLNDYPKYLSETDYLITYWETLIRYNEAIGSFTEAFDFQKKLQGLKTEVQKNRNNIAFIEFERKNALERNRQQIELLNSENAVLEQQRKNQRNILLGGISVASIIGLFLFFLLRNHRKTTKKLRELDSIKSRFFANISHEFRTPLTLISGVLEQQLNSPEISNKNRKELEIIQRNSKRLLWLVDQLLDLSRLESGKYQLHVEKGDLGNLLRALGESFKIRAEQIGVSYELFIDGLNDAWFDKDLIEKVMTNLVSNALKYTETNGEIIVSARAVDNSVRLMVENTATAINLNNIDNLFGRFYQVDSQTDGVGIGLSLVKELVSVNRGSIKVNRTSKHALQFTVELPVVQSAYRSTELTKQPSLNSNITSPPVPENFDTTTDDQPVNHDDRNILLVVEDNNEVRQLIKNTFADLCHVVEAANGQKGFEQALEWVPDLIITDIMMPVMDGLELCAKLKTDERTSHIPIILLTAKAGEEDQYLGLSTGADAYITKPFKIKLLKKQADMLIESRKALRAHYSQEVILKPKDIAITSLDEQFLYRIQDVLDHKLTESSFNIREFSEAVGMSRMQLYRKLKALTGLSASEFIRSQRLKSATTLLQKSDANISQIAYQVGFNDPSYFAQCFRDAYGLSPSEYSRTQTS